MASEGCSTSSYSTFALRIAREARKRRVPLSCVFWVTENCNLRCAHCYIEDEKRVEKRKTMSRDEACDILDQLADEGCLFIIFTGGEVFSRRDFLEIYAHAWDLGMLITIFSNGTMISDRVIDVLEQRPPINIEISLYGYTAPVYEAVTRIPGSHAKCMNGIERVRSSGLNFMLKTPVMSINKQEIPKIAEFAESIGADYLYDGTLMSGLYQSLEPCQLRVPAEELVTMNVGDKKKMKKVRAVYKAALSYAGREDKDCLYQCDAGKCQFDICADAKLYMCGLDRTNGFDLREGSFREGWDSFMLGETERRYTRDVKCIGCGLRQFCSQCPARAAMETGDPEEPIEYYCHYGVLMAAALSTNR